MRVVSSIVSRYPMRVECASCQANNVIYPNPPCDSLSPKAEIGPSCREWLLSNILPEWQSDMEPTNQRGDHCQTFEWLHLIQTWGAYDQAPSSKPISANDQAQRVTCSGLMERVSN